MKKEQGTGNKLPAVDLRERTKDYALRVIRLFGRLPKDQVSQVIGKQVLRSGTSVGANYREATRARSNAEFVAKLGDSLKELDESLYWLELLTESGTVYCNRFGKKRMNCLPSFIQSFATGK
jgi:four helix bundle protein